MLRTGEKEILWAELNSYLKLGAEPEIASEWYVNAPKVELAALLENLEADNFEIQNQKMRLSQTQNQLELAKIDSWPGVTVGASYSDGTGFSPERIYGLGISLPLPVFNSNSLARSSIKSKSQAETEKLNYVSEQTRREITEAYSKYQLAQKTVASLPIQKIAEFEKSIRAIDQDFKRGQVDLITYLEAENQHNESLSAIYEAQTDLVRSLTDLQVLTNKEQLF
ncbi:MAG: TolC family protein [Bdellovibrionaceae bacterium]|nr:TolC family protein [Pseudobdellovibrionaceae bacterium]